MAAVKKKLRILVLNQDFPPMGGGAAPVSYEIAKGYAKLGHKVDVITMHYKGLPYFEKEDGINVYRVPCLRSKKEITHPWELLSYIHSAKKFLRTHMKTHSYDICHCHFIIPTGVIALWLKKNYSLPYIITAHGSDVPGYNPDRFNLMHRFTGPTLRNICKNAKMITSPSRYLANLIKKNIGDYKIKIIPNGINPNSFNPQKKKKIILSTGKLIPRKGFQYLIQAVSNEDLGWELHICGDGPFRKELEDLAKGSKTKIVFHGFLDNKSKEYQDLLGSASIYSLVSLNENASISLLEAMSAGCAVITSNVSGCPETLGDSGIIIDAENVIVLQEAINKLITHPKLIKKYSNMARKRVINNFDWNNLFKKYREVMLK
jgi:glycosyltransferase involved in cell wall biosynthesis